MDEMEIRLIPAAIIEGIRKREAFRKKYCAMKGWPETPEDLSIEQIEEIREQPEWLNATQT